MTAFSLLLQRKLCLLINPFLSFQKQRKLHLVHAGIHLSIVLSIQQIHMNNDRAIRHGSYQGSIERRARQIPLLSGYCTEIREERHFWARASESTRTEYSFSVILSVLHLTWKHLVFSPSRKPSRIVEKEKKAYTRPTARGSDRVYAFSF